MIKNGHSSKTRVKYIVSYFNGSLIEEYATAAREDHPLQTSLAIYVTIKWLEATDFALHTLARLLPSRLSNIFGKVINCAVTFVDEKKPIRRNGRAL